MTVLVTYASRHGATAGIAERIAAALNGAGVPADVKPVADVDDVAGYEAFVVGSAAYMFHWLKPATRFVERHRAVLSAHPLWLFSSGPLGTDLVDKDGRDVIESATPKEFAELQSSLRPRGVRIFFGSLDADAPPIGLAERSMRLFPAARSALPNGDFRDWAAIDAWAAEIASSLRAAA